MIDSPDDAESSDQRSDSDHSDQRSDSDHSALETRLIEPLDFDGLSALFEASHSTCFCRYWHFEGDKNQWLERLALEAETGRSELAHALEARSDEASGLVALEGNRVVGWMKLSRADTMRKIYEQRLYRGLPCFGGSREGVLTLGCMLVLPDLRRRGVARALLRAAVAHGRATGARAIEALPRRPREPVSGEELFMGPWSTLESLGFVEIGGEGQYPVMRLDLGKASTAG